MITIEHLHINLSPAMNNPQELDIPLNPSTKHNGNNLYSKQNKARHFKILVEY